MKGRQTDLTSFGQWWWCDWCSIEVAVVFPERRSAFSSVGVASWSWDWRWWSWQQAVWMAMVMVVPLPNTGCLKATKTDTEVAPSEQQQQQQHCINLRHLVDHYTHTVRCCCCQVVATRMWMCVRTSIDRTAFFQIMIERAWGKVDILYGGDYWRLHWLLWMHTQVWGRRMNKSGVCV